MRAERIYKEISTEHRTELARLLDYFEHALEGKDLDLLESVKSELENFLNNFDGEQDGME